MPIFSHTDIVIDIFGTDDEASSCGADDRVECLSFFEKQRFAAIRSRTPTSTGMLDIFVTNKIALEYSKYHVEFVGFVEEAFGIPREALVEMTDYINTNLITLTPT